MKFNSYVLSLKKNNILNNKYLMLSFISVFTGLILGVIAYAVSGNSELKDIVELFVKFNTDLSDKSKTELFCGTVLSGLPYYFVMFIVGGSIYGGLLCEIITSLKAMGITVVTSFLYANMGLKGLEYALLVFFPGKIILIFSLLFTTATSLEMSQCLINSDKGERAVLIKNYVIKYSVILLLFILSWSVDFICRITFSGLF